MSVLDIVLAASGGGGLRPWNISSTAYRGTVPFTTNLTQETNPRGLFIDPSGINLFVVGTTNDTVYKFYTPTAWKISSAVYANESFSVSAQTTAPTDIFFRSNGLKMYVSSSSAIFQYTLPFAWEFNSASYDSVSLDVSAQTTGANGFFFKPDGTKLYVTSTGTVFQYSLSTAWDLSSATYDSVSFSLSPAGLVNAISFKSDGTKMYVTSLNGITYQYSLSSAWSLSSASYDTVTFVGRSFAYGMFFKDDGTFMYRLNGFVPDFVNQVPLSTAWDLSTAKDKAPYYFAMSLPAGAVGNVYTFTFKTDGTKLYIISEGVVYQYSLPTAWDIATATYDSVSYSLSGVSANPRGIRFKTDGTKMYISDNSDNVYQFSLGTAWNVGTATYDSVSFSTTVETSILDSVEFKSDGTKMYAIDSTLNTIFQYSLPTAWSLVGATYDSVSFSPSAQGTASSAFSFKTDGTVLYIAVGDGINNNVIYQYSLSSPWSLASVTYSSLSKSLVPQNIYSVNDMAFRSNGSRMYILDRGLGTLLQYEVG
jgi:hypothetical protein